MFERSFRSPEQEAVLAPDECWAIVWRASNYLSSYNRMNPFVAEYFNRMFDIIQEMQDAGEVLSGELPDDEVPRVRFKEVVDREMASLNVIVPDDMLVWTARHISKGIDAVEVALEQAFADHKQDPLPTQITSEYL